MCIRDSIYMGAGKLKEGAKLQMILTADGKEARSNVLTVEPSPDWGQPYAAFDVAAVKADAETIPVTVDYSDEYLSLGDGFYCDVTIYQFPADYTDEEFEDGELWENVSIAQRVAQANSTTGTVTKGQIEVPVLENAELEVGDRLIIKLRLPHTEWEGEEVDYIFASVPVIGADDEVPDYKVVLYNLSEETSRGERLRTILEELGIPAEEMTDDRLNETVGYLAGIDGYEAAGEPYEGEGKMCIRDRREADGRCSLLYRRHRDHKELQFAGRKVGGAVGKLPNFQGYQHRFRREPYPVAARPQCPLCPGDDGALRPFHISAADWSDVPSVHDGNAAAGIRSVRAS